MFLVLLDLSAAFDTIDNGILQSHLESIGVKGLALKWICSYTLAIESNHSTLMEPAPLRFAPAPLRFGVPP